MIKWIKSIFEKRKAENAPTDTAPNSELLEQFKVFLADRMDAFYPNVRDAFAKLLDADFPDDIKGFHIEVLLDEPAFSLRLFSKGENDFLGNEPDAVKEFNDTIDRLWPIVTQDELDQYTIWEDDPKWGRQEALEQPLDTLSFPRIVLPWLKKIVSESKGTCSRPITASVHDFTLPEEL